MVEGHFGKRHRAGMAQGAIIRGGQMANIHAGANHAIVTACAVIHDTGMIIEAGGKGAQGMTGIAIVGGGHVVAGFTRGCSYNGIVVAGIAALSIEVNTTVIEDPCLGKRGDVVTYTAIKSRHRVI